MLPRASKQLSGRAYRGPRGALTFLDTPARRELFTAARESAVAFSSDTVSQYLIGAGGALSRIAALLLAIATPSGALAAGKSPADLVLVARGALPILLTAPHGGREVIPGVAPRDVKRAGVAEQSRKWGGAVTSSDGNTDVLALRMAAEIRRLTGQAPYLVVAKFQRKYIDANRPAEIAVDSPAALPYYDLYHRSIREFVEEILRTHSAGLLIDVHGQNKDPGVLMRGTVNGRTVLKLVRRAGVGAITGPEGLFGRLEAVGFKVFPANSEGLGARSEDAGLNGGYTTRLYGSDNAGGIDAVQFEFGTVYRHKERVEKSAVDAGRAVVAFYERYLGKERGERQKVVETIAR